MNKGVSHLFTTRLLILIAMLFTSCIKDVDFDQAEEFELYTSQDIDLIYFSLSPDNFINPNTGNLETTFVRERSVIDFFDEDFFQRNLKEIKFLFGVESTFSQSFVCRIRFLDPNNQQLISVDFNVNGSPDGSVVLTEAEFIFTGAELNLFKFGPVKKIEISLEIDGNGPPSGGNLKFKSKALYTIELT